MSDEQQKSVDALRKQVHSYLMGLTPEEAKALRARYRISATSQPDDQDEDSLRAIARELAKLKKRR